MNAVSRAQVLPVLRIFEHQLRPFIFKTLRRNIDPSKPNRSNIATIRRKKYFYKKSLNQVMNHIYKDTSDINKTSIPRKTFSYCTHKQYAL